MSVIGVVTDKLQQPIQSANVLLMKVGTGTIISYSITNKKGEYKLQSGIKFFKDSFYVQVQSFGFANQRLSITSVSQSINFVLEPEITFLPNVTVQAKKPKPISAQGDTITYQVADFKNPTDRVISDVIKKLPGVEVDNNGKITYQGKSISRFYIDGDNLLDDKYNIATNSVPSDMIVSVQVLENHQPIKALENVQYNSDPAMNIITKASARQKLINDGKAAIGVPDVYDITLNSLLLRKEIKFINYYKLNNAGVDLAKDLISHNLEDNQKKIDYQPISDILQLNHSFNPGLEKKRYLLNNSGLVNLNDLINLKKGIQLKVNVFYLYDKQYQTFKTSTTFYSPVDTINYKEDQNSINKINIFRTQFNLNINKSKYYLNNTLALDNSTNWANASLQTNSNNSINQNINGSHTNFTNEMTLVKVLDNKQIIQVYSYTENNISPQSLKFEPGLYNNLVNEDKPYKQLNQFVKIPGFFTTNYFSISKTYGPVIYSSKIGASFNAQKLISNVNLLQQDNTINQLSDSFANQLDWKQYKSFIKQEFVYKTNPLQITFSLPLNYSYIVYRDPIHKKLDSSVSLIPINPALQLQLFSGGQNSFSASVFTDNRIGNIADIYKGAIFVNYRNIISNESPFQQTRSIANTFNYFFKKTIDGLFINMGIVNIASERNVMNNINVSNTIQQRNVIYKKNNTSYQSFSSSINKYIFKWKTDIKTGFAVIMQKADQLQNGNLFHFQNTSYTYKLKIDSKLTSKFYGSYICIYTNSVNKQIIDNGLFPNSEANSLRIEQQWELNFLVNKNFYLKWNMENYYNSFPSNEKNRFIFFDANATIRINKLNADIQLIANNIIGNNEYNTLFLSSNMVSENALIIRPRNVLIKFNYRF